MGYIVYSVTSQLCFCYSAAFHIYRGSGSSFSDSAMLHCHVFYSSSEWTNQALPLWAYCVFTFLAAPVGSPTCLAGESEVRPLYASIGILWATHNHFNLYNVKPGLRDLFFHKILPKEFTQCWSSCLEIMLHFEDTVQVFVSSWQGCRGIAALKDLLHHWWFRICMQSYLRFMVRLPVSLVGDVLSVGAASLQMHPSLKHNRTITWNYIMNHVLKRAQNLIFAKLIMRKFASRRINHSIWSRIRRQFLLRECAVLKNTRSNTFGFCSSEMFHTFSHVVELFYWNEEE